MNIFKRIFRRPAIIIVTLYAKHIYEQGVKAAEARRLREHITVYLASDSFHPDWLVTYTKPDFKAEKRIYGTAAQLLTMNTLRRGCYYYTADRFGEHGMTDMEKERRKKAFIKERLLKARLIER